MKNIKKENIIIIVVFIIIFIGLTFFVGCSHVHNRCDKSGHDGFTQCILMDLPAVWWWQ